MNANSHEPTTSVSRDPNKRPDNSRPLGWVLLLKYGLIGGLRLIWTDVLIDRRLGIDTSRPVDNTRLAGPDRVHQHNRYVPSTFDAVRSSLAYIEEHIDLSSCDFLDYGSGKGKALIAAAEFPFKHLKGIEYADTLHDIAQRNINTLGLDERITLLHADAATYRPEASERVLYFFNPFTGDVLERCLALIATESLSLERIVVSVNPTEDAVFLQYFDKFAEEDFDPGGVQVNFYRTRPE